MNYTKGKWQAIENDSWGERHKDAFGDRKGFVICYSEQGQKCALASVIGIPFVPQQEIDANAKLIAQAPQLLKMLIKAKDAWRELAITTGEEGLLKEDVIYQEMLLTIKNSTSNELPQTNDTLFSQTTDI